MPAKRKRLFVVLVLYVLVVFIPALVILNFTIIKDRFGYLSGSIEESDTIFGELFDESIKFTGEITDPTEFIEGRVGVTIRSPPELAGYHAMEIRCDPGDVTIGYLSSDGSVQYSVKGTDLDFTDDRYIINYLALGFKVASYCRDDCSYMYKVCSFTSF